MKVLPEATFTLALLIVLESPPPPYLSLTHTHTQLTIIHDFSFGESNAFFWPLWAPGTYTVHKHRANK